MPSFLGHPQVLWILTVCSLIVRSAFMAFTCAQVCVCVCLCVGEQSPPPAAATATKDTSLGIMLKLPAYA